eukprot:gene11793-29854_t
MPVGFLAHVDKQTLEREFRERRASSRDKAGKKFKTLTSSAISVARLLLGDSVPKEERLEKTRDVLDGAPMRDLLQALQAPRAKPFTAGTKENMFLAWGQWRFPSGFEVDKQRADPELAAFVVEWKRLQRETKKQKALFKAGSNLTEQQELFDERTRKAWVPLKRLPEAIDIWEQKVQERLQLPANDNPELLRNFLQTKMIVSLFSLQPALRKSDWTKIYLQPQADAVAAKKNTIARNDNGNYAVTLRDTKTVGNDVLEVTLELDATLSFDIDMHLAVSTNQQFLLENPKGDRGKPIPNGTLAELIKQGFSVLTGNLEMTAGTLRKIWVTYKWQEFDVLPSVEEQVDQQMDLASRMCHSIETAERSYNMERFLNPYLG